MKKSSDIALLKSVISFYSIFATFPPTTFKLPISVALFVPFTVCSTFLTLKAYLVNVLRMTTIGSFLYICTTITMMLFNISCFRNLFVNRSSWSELLKKIEEYDFLMEEYRNHREKNTYMYYLQVIFLNMGNLLIFIIVLFSAGDKFTIIKLICYIYVLFTNLQVFATAFMFWSLLTVVCTRYMILEQKLIDCYSAPIHFNAFWNEHQTKVSVYWLNDMMLKINQIFGVRILLTLVLTFFSVLNMFDYIFFDLPFPGEKTTVHIFTVGLATFIFLVSIK